MMEFACFEFSQDRMEHTKPVLRIFESTVCVLFCRVFQFFFIKNKYFLYINI